MIAEHALVVLGLGLALFEGRLHRVDELDGGEKHAELEHVGVDLVGDGGDQKVHGNERVEKEEKRGGRMREKRGVGEKRVLDEIAEFSGVEEDPAIGDDLACGGGGLCVAELKSDERGGVIGGEGDEGGGVIDDGGLAATERREGGEKREDVGVDEVEQTEVEFVEVDGGVRGLHGRGVDEVVIGVGGGGETEIAARVRGEFAERTGDGLNGKKERGKRERGKKREKKGGELRGRREVKEGGVEEEREIARAAADEREKEKALNRRVCGEVCEGILQERERGVGENSGGWAMSQRESKRTGSRAGSSPAPAASPRG